MKLTGKLSLLFLILALPALLFVSCTHQSSPAVLAVSTVSPTPEPTVTPSPTPVLPELSELEKELVSQYSRGDGTLGADLLDLIAQLKDLDAIHGAAWEELMLTWEQINLDSELICADVCPDDLPEDSSLCIVVLGYQLNSDGSMTEELIGRCRTALNCAQKYPQAHIVVTGGGTATLNSLVTEADSMAQWLISHGVEAERILIENDSLSTSQNALFTGPILSELAPEVRELVIVTSDYHIRRGWMTFSAQLILSGSPARVTANAAYITGKEDSPIATQASELSGVARYYY